MVRVKQNYTQRHPASGGLPRLLQSYGSVGGANGRVMAQATKQASEAGSEGHPLILARIYASAPIRNTTLVPPYEANATANVASMMDRIYQPLKG